MITANSEVYQPIAQSHVTAVLFREGWRVFSDQAIMVGWKPAILALQRCIDYCSFNLAVYQAQLSKIGSMGDLNPRCVDDIEENIMRLGVEVYFCAHENRLFEIGHMRDLPYQFYHIGPDRLYLQRLK